MYFNILNENSVYSFHFSVIFFAFLYRSHANSKFQCLVDDKNLELDRKKSEMEDLQRSLFAALDESEKLREEIQESTKKSKSKEKQSPSKSKARPKKKETGSIRDDLQNRKSSSAVSPIMVSEDALMPCDSSDSSSSSDSVSSPNSLRLKRDHYKLRSRRLFVIILADFQTRFFYLMLHFVVSFSSVLSCPVLFSWFIEFHFRFVSFL